ncbi:discoidin domain-containing protein [Candidatus Saccharibacteria bacterium]|nr:discoidin domain-containing protein [Candidatus Saccharibacteria bacterium]
MAGIVRLQSDLVRTGDKAYQFLAENDTAYLQAEATRLGFAFYAAEEQSGRLLLAQLLGTHQYEIGTPFDNNQAVKINKQNFTAPTNGTHTVSANKEHPSWPAWKAFEGTMAQYWWDGGSPPFILTYDFGETVTVSSYKLGGSPWPESVPGVWTFEYSVDNSTWQIAHNQTVRQSYTANQIKTFVLSAPVVGRYFRWVITQNSVGSINDDITVGEAEIWGKVGVQGVTVVDYEGSLTTLHYNTATRKLYITDWEDVIVGETAQSFAPDAWHYIELVNGELRHNGVTILTWTPAGTATDVRLGIGEASTGEFYADDIVLSNGETWPGPVRCHLLQPNDDIEETGWNRLPTNAPTAHSTLTDGDDASYLYSQQGVIRVGLADLPDENEILAVQVMSRLSVDAEGETDVSFLLDEAIIDTQTLTTTPTWYTHLALVNPATDAAWTAEEVNALDIGWMMVVIPDAPRNLTATNGSTNPTDIDVTFDPPTFTGGADIIEYEAEVNGPGVVDDAQALLIINSDHTNGSTTITDSSPNAHTFSRYGNLQHSTAAAKFGASSLYFDGAGDYLNVNSPTGFNWGTGDYRITYWCRLPADQLTTIQEYVWIGANTWNAGGLDIQFRGNTNEYVLWIYQSGANMSQYYVIPPGTVLTDWHYIEVTRVSGQMYFSINGVQLVLKAGSNRVNSYNFNFVTQVSLGWAYSMGAGTQIFKGYIDNFVIETKAGHTGDFTPPTALQPPVGLPTTETQTGASSPITFLAKPYNITYDVRVRARNLKGWGAWTTPIFYLHQMPFSPTDITGLFGWWAADNPESTASAWRDSSGNNRHIQPNTGPYSLADHEGKLAWSFSTTTQMFLMTPTARPANGNLTVFIVCKPTQSSNVSGMLHQLNGTTTRYDWWWGIANGSSMFDMRPNAATGTVRWTASNSGYTSRNVHVIRTANGSPNRLFLGATAVGSGASANYGAGNASDRLYVGGSLPGGGGAWTGYIYELLIYHATLSDADVTAIRDWLITKHSL